VVENPSKRKKLIQGKVRGIKRKVSKASRREDCFRAKDKRS
jgi:hypothetical protein